MVLLSITVGNVNERSPECGARKCKRACSIIKEGGKKCAPKRGDNGQDQDTDAEELSEHILGCYHQGNILRVRTVGLGSSRFARFGWSVVLDFGPSPSHDMKSSPGQSVFIFLFFDRIDEKNKK